MNPNQPSQTPTPNKPKLLGTWRHSEGMIFCGTLRIAKADFDTNPNDKFRDDIFDDICETMNALCEAINHKTVARDSDQQQPTPENEGEVTLKPLEFTNCPFCGRRPFIWAESSKVGKILQCLTKECPIHLVKFFEKDWQTRMPQSPSQPAGMKSADLLDAASEAAIIRQHGIAASWEGLTERISSIQQNALTSRDKEVAELKKDRERLDWLESSVKLDYSDIHYSNLNFKFLSFRYQFRLAIDNAISGKKS